MTTTTTPLQDHVGLRAPLLFAAIILLGFGLSYSLAGATLGRVLFPAAATGRAGTPTNTVSANARCAAAWTRVKPRVAALDHENPQM